MPNVIMESVSLNVIYDMIYDICIFKITERFKQEKILKIMLVVWKTFLCLPLQSFPLKAFVYIA